MNKFKIKETDEIIDCDFIGCDTMIYFANRGINSYHIIALRPIGLTVDRVK